MQDQLLFVSDAARLLGRSTQTVRNYVERGKLPAVRAVGGIRLFKESDVQKLAEELCVTPQTAA